MSKELIKVQLKYFPEGGYFEIFYNPSPMETKLTVKFTEKDLDDARKEAT